MLLRINVYLILSIKIINKNVLNINFIRFQILLIRIIAVIIHNKTH